MSSFLFWSKVCIDMISSSAPTPPPSSPPLNSSANESKRNCVYMYTSWSTVWSDQKTTTLSLVLNDVWFMGSALLSHLVIKVRVTRGCGVDLRVSIVTPSGRRNGAAEESEEDDMWIRDRHIPTATHGESTRSDAETDKMFSSSYSKAQQKVFQY